MNITVRSRRAVMAVAAAITLGLGALTVVTAAPASADTGVGTPTITDNVQGTVTTPDDIVTCQPALGFAIGGTTAVTIPVGCLTEYYGDNVTVTWSGTGISTELTLQTNGNLVLQAGNGKTWAASTTAADKSTGPGCEAPYQSGGNLVVDNCAGTAIWSSNTAGYTNDAFLAFQADGNLVMYYLNCGIPNSCVHPGARTNVIVPASFVAVWATGTNS